MNRTTAAAAALCALSFGACPAAAQAPPAALSAEWLAQAIAACHGIAEAGPRLGCYDGIATFLEPPPPVEPPPVPVPVVAPGTGAWERETERDLITDALDTFWTLAATRSYRTTDPVLVVRCMSGEIAAFVVWREYIRTDDGQEKVTWRLDGDQGHLDFWFLNDDQDITAAPNPEQFLLRIRPGRMLAIEVAPARDDVLQAEFEITGIGAVITDVAAACGWQI